jgi:hypothetical protein
MSPAAPIRLISTKIEPSELATFIGHPFPDMVKFVVDVDREVIALGGALHSDAEAILLEHGSVQASLWGGNYYPGVGEGECVEYESLINIRPNQNIGMVVVDSGTRGRMRELVFRLIGRGETLS